MDERIDLDTILNGEPAQERSPEPTAPEPEVKADAPAVEPTGAKPDAGPPPVSAEPNEPPHVPRKALEDERRKRQEAEKQLEQLSKQIQSFQQQPPPQAQPAPQPVHQEAGQFPPRPDPHEDPIGAIEWDRAVAQHQIFETRVNLSYEMMQDKPNYSEFVQLFGQAAQSDPTLVAQLQRHPLPAKFAYEMGRQLAFLRDVGTDPEAYEKKLREKWLAEQQQTQEPPQAQAAPAVKAPKSLASTTSAQPRLPNGQFAERADLSDILGG